MYRGLDPQLGRFNSIDPKPDSTFNISPYASMNNDPARYTDPKGDIAFLAPVVWWGIVEAAAWIGTAYVAYETSKAAGEEIARNRANTANSLPSPTKTEEKKETHGGGKNGAHANQKARDAAKDRYESAKAEYEELKSKPNKTKDESKELDKLKIKVKHEKGKMDNTGENHSQKAKGN